MNYSKSVIILSLFFIKTTFRWKFIKKGAKMTLYDLNIGEFAQRKAWANKELKVKRESLYTFVYYEGTKRTRRLSPESVCFAYNDFIKIKGENEMKNVKVIVVVEGERDKYFETEEAALDYVAYELEETPRTTFYMFKLYQKVQPKRPDLSDLIVKCD